MLRERSRYRPITQEPRADWEERSRLCVATGYEPEASNHRQGPGSMRKRNDAPRTAQAFQANSSTNQRAAARARAQAKERELEAARAKRLGTGKTKPKLPPGRAMLRGLEAFVRWRYRADGGRCVTDDGEMIVDVLLCFWASVARELGMQPGWARAWASIIVPVLADEHDDRWWLARERRALRRRKGCGWKPDAVAEHWLIREWELIACFGEDHRRRCGLVSRDRPPEVRAAERKAKDKARKVGKGGSTPRRQWLDNSAARTKPWEAFGIGRRAWERRGKPAPPQPEATTQVCPQHSPVRDMRTHLRLLA